MPQRTKLIIALFALLVVLAGAVFAWRTMGRSTVEPVVIDEPELDSIAETGPSEDLKASPVLPLDDQEKKELSLKQEAVDFAEKFGSYSSYSNFDNIRDLRPQMSAEMRTWSDEYVLSQKGKIEARFGVTTKALNSKVIRYEPDEEAVVLVSTQRQEISASKKKVYYQDIEIEFVSEDGQWKVDAVQWRPL